MSSTTDKAARTHKPIIWWKAGLLGAFVSLTCLLCFVVFANIYKDFDYSEHFFLALFTIPSAIFTAIYTAKNRGDKKNLSNTIKVAIACISGPAIIGFYFLYTFFALVTDLLGDEPYRWTMEDTAYAVMYLATIYGSTLVIALVLWTAFGQKVMTRDESF